MTTPSSDLHEVNFRPTSEGFDLFLVSTESLETERKLGLLVVSEDAVLELVMGRDKAQAAYDHPTVTPGIAIEPAPEPWDQALDALNELSPKERHKALRSMERMRGIGMAPHVIIMEAVSNRTHDRRSAEAA